CSRLPSILSETRCATSLIRHNRDMIDGRLHSQTPRSVRTDPAWRIVHHLRPALRAAVRPGSPDRRSFCHSRYGGKYSPAARSRSAVPRTVRYLSLESRTGRFRTLLPAEDGSYHSSCFSIAGNLCLPCRDNRL